MKAKEEWQQEQKQKMEAMEQKIVDLAEHFDKHSEMLGEMLEFGAKFYQYSYNNQCLIYSQNPRAVYVQSFQAWKEVGCSVKRGERGMNIWVPVKATYLKISENEIIPLRQASKEQKAAYQRNEIESYSKTLFKVGTVFDIAQTTFPKERYPEMIHMGYASEQHRQIAGALKIYSQEKLDCPVITDDLHSVGLRGYYKRDEHRIVLNQELEDTMALSTLSHELGHALIHNDMESIKKSTAQVEFEADALSIMVSSHYGISVTDQRTAHLVAHYKHYKMTDGFEKIQESLRNVSAIFRQEIPQMDQYVDRELSMDQGLSKESVIDKEWKQVKDQQKVKQTDRGEER